MVASTVDRVPRHTSQEINRQIEIQIAESVRWHAAHPEGIDRRLHELDQEWDVERTLEANASTPAFTGVMLGATMDKRWLALPAIVTGSYSSMRCRAGVPPAHPAAAQLPHGS